VRRELAQRWQRGDGLAQAGEFTRATLPSAIRATMRSTSLTPRSASRSGSQP
jgi:hypothetical protein